MKPEADWERVERRNAESMRRGAGLPPRKVTDTPRCRCVETTGFCQAARADCPPEPHCRSCGRPF